MDLELVRQSVWREHSISVQAVRDRYAKRMNTAVRFYATVSGRQESVRFFPGNAKPIEGRFNLLSQNIEVLIGWDASENVHCPAFDPPPVDPGYASEPHDELAEQHESLGVGILLARDPSSYAPGDSPVRH